MKVDAVFEERYWYPDDGSIIWLSGYTVLGDDGRFLARDAPELEARGLIVTSIAGAARHHAAALESDGAGPGSPLELRRDPANEHDHDAIAVHLAGDPADAVGERLGWVRREIAARLAPELDAGTAWSARVLRESRPSPRDPRAGVTVLLARADALELRDTPRSPPPQHLARIHRFSTPDRAHDSDLSTILGESGLSRDPPRFWGVSSHAEGRMTSWQGFSRIADAR